MKILVTGGTGMLGRSFIYEHSNNLRISFTGRNREAGKAIERKTGARFYAADLHSADQYVQICKGVDGIVHCAALSAPWGSRKDFLRVNVEGTRNLIAAAKINNVPKFIYISSPSIYFNYQDMHQVREDNPLPQKFCNDYAESKAIAEQEILQNLPEAIVLRPRGIFGPHDNAIIPRVMRAAQSGTLWLPSRRNPSIDLTYVGNVVQSIFLALKDPDLKGEVFNITNDEPAKLIDILELLFSSVSLNVKFRFLPYPVISQYVRAQEILRARFCNVGEPRLTSYSAALFHYHQTLNIDKAKKVLGYSPQTTLAQGILNYGKWYKSQVL